MPNVNDTIGYGKWFQPNVEYKFERTVELKPGQYVDGKMSDELKRVVENNGADDVIWTQGDRVFLSSTRRDNLELPSAGLSIRFGETKGYVKLVIPQDNTQSDLEPRINSGVRRDGEICRPNQKPQVSEKAKANMLLSTFWAGTLGVTVGMAASGETAKALAKRAPTMIYTYRSVKAIPAATPKLAGAIAKHPVAVMAVAGAALAGAAIVGGRALALRADAKEQKRCDDWHKKTTEIIEKGPDYDMANQVGTPIKD